MTNKGTIKSVLSSSIIYAIASILTGSISFIMMPVYTTVMAPNEIGILSIANSISSFLLIFTTLSLESAASRFYYIEEEKDKCKFNGTIIIFVLVQSLIMLIASNVILKRAFIDIFKDVNFKRYLLLGTVIASTKPIYIIYQSILQARQESKRYAVNSILFMIVSVVFTLYFILVLNMAVVGVLLATVIACIIFSCLSLVVLKKRSLLVWEFDLKKLKRALNYSLPLVPYVLVNSFVPLYIKTMISRNLSIDYAGYYEVAIQFSLLISVAQLAINRSYAPWAYERYNYKDYNRVFKFAEIITLISCFVGIFIFGFSKDLVLIISNRRYIIAASMLPWMVIAAFFRGVYYYYANILSYEINHTKYITLAAVCGGVVNIIIPILLVKYVGIYSILFGNVAASIVNLYIAFKFSSDILPIKMRINKHLFYAAIMVIGGVLLLIVEYFISTREVAFIFKILMMFIFAILGFKRFKYIYNIKLDNN